jgi:hypothetical protein
MANDKKKKSPASPQDKTEGKKDMALSLLIVKAILKDVGPGSQPEHGEI